MFMAGREGNCALAVIGKGAPVSLVEGTVYAPDSYTIPTVSVHWIYKGVKQGARKLERLGIIV